MTILQKKQIHVLITVALITLVVILLYPIGDKALLAIRGQSYSSRSSLRIYPYSLPKTLTVENTSTLLPVQAVPIFMYHGVGTGDIIETNTSRETFIRQMEMLKQKGYQTISVKEYDLFREGKFTLPPKPIIITFDDGRKDSFYTVDEILRKLGFKATLFVATIKANENDSFYLNWDELAKVQATGRWEIEAHGRRSHDKILIDKNGTIGRYYTSRIYTPEKGLESIEDYKKRVEEDYIDGIVDIKEHLGIDVRYFAVPLSNYGVLENFNYPDALRFNQELTGRFFKLAFLEIEAFESFYNYRDSNPHSLIRLEVKNISADNLFQLLERYSPKSLNLVFSKIVGLELFTKNTQLLYGRLETSKGITLLSGTSMLSARMLFGDRGWKNYSVKTKLVREKGRSVSLLIYYTDEHNFISLDWGQKLVRLTEHVNGKEQELVSYFPWEKNDEVEISVRIYNGVISAKFEDLVLTNGLPIQLTRGAVGLGVWDPESAQSTINEMEIESLETSPAPFISPAIPTLSLLSNPSVSTSVPVVIFTPELKVIAKNLPYLSDGFGDNDWEKLWGNLVISDGVLEISSSPLGKGGGVFLRGSNSWIDYALTTEFDWLKGQTFSLLSRYQDSNNYLACSYVRYGGGVALVQVVNGKAATLVANYFLPIPYSAAWFNINVGMKVKDNHVECLINNEWVLRSDIDAMPKVGGVGFEIWDSVPDNSQINIKNVSVSSL